MPLSEDEQRILHEIEAQFHAEDPKLARDVSRASVYAHAGRRLKLALAGVALGLVLMVVFLVLQSVPLALVAFGIAFAAGVAAWYSFRRMTQAGINDLRRKSREMWQKGMVTDRIRRRRDGDEL